MKHFLSIVLILSSFAVVAQKKEPKTPPNPPRPDLHVPLEAWAIQDLDALEFEIAKTQQQLKDTQNYLSVLQIRKEDISRTIVLSDKNPNKPPIENIAKFERQGSVILLTLKPDSLINVKPDSLKKK